MNCDDYDPKYQDTLDHRSVLDENANKKNSSVVDDTSGNVSARTMIRSHTNNSRNILNLIDKLSPITKYKEVNYP